MGNRLLAIFAFYSIQKGFLELQRTERLGHNFDMGGKVIQSLMGFLQKKVYSYLTAANNGYLLSITRNIVNMHRNLVLVMPEFMRIHFFNFLNNSVCLDCNSKQTKFILRRAKVNLWGFGTVHCKLSFLKYVIIYTWV